MIIEEIRWSDGMATRTFREMVTSRTVIASAPVEKAQFKGMIERVNEQFGLELAPSLEAFELFQDQILFVAGRFWEEGGGWTAKPSTNG